MKKVFVLAALALLLAGCGQKKQVRLIDAANFNKEVDGKQVSLYTMQRGDITMQVTNYGGRVVALWTPDKNKNYEDVVLGYDHIDKYLNNTGERYLGAVVGRYANRIAGGSFALNDTVYELAKNEGKNTLHGGEIGTDRMVWDVVSHNDSSIVMRVVLPDGQDGFPGNLDITMTYTLTNDNAFRIDYLATTDKPTLCNLSNHTFFNLKGEGNTVLDEQLEIKGNWILPVDENLIPTGSFTAVKGTPFDFREMHGIGDKIHDDHDQLKMGQGYDHNWIIDHNSFNKIEYCAALYEPTNERLMEVYTDQIGLQFYSGNFFDGKSQGKWGTHLYRGGIALETQNFPDAIHQNNFSLKSILNPGEQYHHTCIYKFSVSKRK